MVEEKKKYPEGERIFEAMENIDGDLIGECTWEAFESRHGKTGGRLIRLGGRKIAALAAAAVMVMAFGAVGFAAEINSDFDAALLRTLGLSPDECMQLEDGTVQIDASALSHGTSYISDGAVVENGVQQDMTVKVDQSIGDDRSAVVRFSTDLDAPAGMVEGVDYLYFDDQNITLTDNGLFGSVTGSGYGTTTETVVENGKVGIVLTIMDMEDLNTASVDISLGRLMLCHDLGDVENAPAAQLVYDGCWDLKWTYNYSSRKRVVKLNQDVGTGEEAVTLKSVEISPIGIHAEATGSRLSEAWKAAEDPESGGDRPVKYALAITGIRMADGSEMQFDNWDVGGVSTDLTGISYSCYVNTASQGKGVLIPDQVTGLIVNGVEVPLG